MKWPIILVISLLFIFQNCSRHCNCYTGPTTYQKDSSTRNSFRLSELSREPLDSSVKTSLSFGHQLATINGNYFYCVLTDKEELLFFEISDDASRRPIKLQVKFPVKKGSLFSAFFTGDTLHILGINPKIYYRCKVSLDKGLTVLDSFDLKEFMRDKNLYILHRVAGKSFEYNYPYLYIPYGDARKKNYIDKYSFIRIDIANRTARKIISYPDCYSCSAIYEPNGLLARLKNYSTVSVFEKADLITVTDSSGGIQKSNTIAHACKFEPFKSDEEQNLAYIKKEMGLAEKNVALVNIKDSFYIVVKRNARKSFSEPVTFRIFIFDANLEQIYSHEPGHSLYYPSVFPYKEGFLLFSEDTLTAYYYQIN